MEHKKRIQLGTMIRWAGTILSLGLFIWLLARQDWNAVLASASGLSLWAVLLALALQVGSFAFNNLRWCLLLWGQNVQIGFWQAWKINFAGSFASNFLPSTIGGDGFRMVAIYPFVGRKTIALGSVALDRVINMAAMACLLPAPLTIFGPKAFTSFMLVLPGGLQNLLDRYFPKITTALRDWAARPLPLAWAFVAAWPSNLLPIGITYLLARQLGMDVDFWQVTAVQTVAYFVAVLPVSVNGIGVRELVFTTLLPLLGSSIEQASTLALLTRFVGMAATLPGALWLTKTVSNVVEME